MTRGSPVLLLGPRVRAALLFSVRSPDQRAGRKAALGPTDPAAHHRRVWRNDRTPLVLVSSAVFRDGVGRCSPTRHLGITLLVHRPTPDLGIPPTSWPRGSSWRLDRRPHAQASSWVPAGLIVSATSSSSSTHHRVLDLRTLLCFFVGPVQSASRSSCRPDLGNGRETTRVRHHSWRCLLAGLITFDRPNGDPGMVRQSGGAVRAWSASSGSAIRGA